MNSSGCVPTSPDHLSPVQVLINLTHQEEQHGDIYREGLETGGQCQMMLIWKQAVLTARTAPTSCKCLCRAQMLITNTQTDAHTDAHARLPDSGVFVPSLSFIQSRSARSNCRIMSTRTAAGSGPSLRVHGAAPSRLLHRVSQSTAEKREDECVRVSVSD